MKYATIVEPAPTLAGPVEDLVGLIVDKATRGVRGPIVTAALVNQRLVHDPARFQAHYNANAGAIGTYLDGLDGQALVRYMGLPSSWTPAFLAGLALGAGAVYLYTRSQR